MVYFVSKNLEKYSLKMWLPITLFTKQGEITEAKIVGPKKLTTFEFLGAKKDVW